MSKISWQHRFFGQEENPCFAFGAIDTFCVRIQKPSQLQSLYYCSTHNHHSLKFELVINIISHMICWVGGGVGGRQTDLEIARNCIVGYLLSGERLWADKIYSDRRYFLTPIKGFRDDNHWNQVHSRLRFQRIERVNGVLKSWGILSGRWRGDHTELLQVVTVLSNLYNFSLLMGFYDNTMGS